MHAVCHARWPACAHTHQDDATLDKQAWPLAARIISGKQALRTGCKSFRTCTKTNRIVRRRGLRHPVIQDRSRRWHRGLPHQALPRQVPRKCCTCCRATSSSPAWRMHRNHAASQQQHAGMADKQTRQPPTNTPDATPRSSSSRSPACRMPRPGNDHTSHQSTNRPLAGLPQRLDTAAAWTHELRMLRPATTPRQAGTQPAGCTTSLRPALLCRIRRRGNGAAGSHTHTRTHTHERPHRCPGMYTQPSTLPAAGPPLSPIAPLHGHRLHAPPKHAAIGPNPRPPHKMAGRDHGPR